MAKILVVDDSATVRGQLKADLSAEGHDVIEACDGLDGLSKVNSSTPLDLIICDVNMPNMDGLTMCEKLAESSGTGLVPIFMLTTEVTANFKERAKQCGVKAWITKPYVLAKLLAAVAKVIEK